MLDCPVTSARERMIILLDLKVGLLHTPEEIRFDLSEKLYEIKSRQLNSDNEALNSLQIENSDHLNMF
jgi:hypothetical protein